MLRFIPPAGVPLTTSAIFRAVLTAAGNGAGSSDAVLTSIAKNLRVKHAFVASSGRAALSIVLRSLAHLKPGRDIIAIPAYTCFSVAAPVVRAGLKIYPVEMDPSTLDLHFDTFEQWQDERALCVLSSNLFGMPSDLRRARQVAQANDAFVIDDAAQALGARQNGYLAGTAGDVGIYSLGRGKAATTMGGGIIVTNCDPIAQLVREEMRSLPRPHGGATVRLLAEMLFYSAFLRPELYWIPNSMPFLELGKTEFDPAFASEGLHPISQALLPRVFAELPELNRIRQANAQQLIEALDDARFLIPAPALDSSSTWVRFPLIARDEKLRDRALEKLREAGIGATASYPSAICDIPGIEAHMACADFHRPVAEKIARTLLTLPVNPYVSAKDIRRMVETLKAA
jgi:perosamine synthetase